MMMITYFRIMKNNINLFLRELSIRYQFIRINYINFF